MPTVTKQTTKPVKAKPSGGGILSRIKPIQDVETGYSLLIYGRSGTGKTRVAVSFPKPLLLIGSEDGTKSVSKEKGVDFVRLTESADMPTLIEHARENYKTVVLDTATMLQDLILAEILGRDQLPTQKSWGMATRDQYGQCGLQTKEHLRSLLNLINLGIHVVIVAQERNFTNETESEILSPSMGANMQPGVAGWLNPAVDYIAQTFLRQSMEEVNVKIGGTDKKVKRATGKTDFCLRVGPDPIFTTKFRLPKGTELPEVIVMREKDSVYEKIAALIEGE